MHFQKQVNRSHYSFSSYYTKARWSSLWHQMHEVLHFDPKSVLEVGAGLGMFKQAMSCFGVTVTSVDIAEYLNPDIVGSVTDLPVTSDSFDVACAFQVLEHIPFDYFAKSLSELKRVSRLAVVISLPDAKLVYPSSLTIPKVGIIEFDIPKPFVNYAELPLWNEHMWEVNRPGFSVEDIIQAFHDAGLRDVKTYRVNTNKYHRFFVSKIET